MSTNIPLAKQIIMRYYATQSFYFPLTENGVPVTDDLNIQTFKLHIKSDNPALVSIEKDIVDEGWVVNNTTKYIRVVINTEAYKMVTADTSTTKYTGRLEWVDRKLILVEFSIDIKPCKLWSTVP